VGEAVENEINDKKEEREEYKICRGAELRIK
jgi:hypothetical protein